MEQEKSGFVSIEQFRTLEYELNVSRLAQIVIAEAQTSGMNLRLFLTRTVLCNHGAISTPEICALVGEIFAAERSDAMLGALDRDKCLGYTQEEIAAIRCTLKSPEAMNYRSTAIHEALGCKMVTKYPHR